MPWFTWCAGPEGPAPQKGTMSDTYEGWTNMETWGFNLILSNDEVLYRYWTAEAERIVAGSDDGTERMISLANLFSLWHSHMRAEHPEHDLVKHAGLPFRVNYDEVAADWVATAEEEAGR